MSKARARAPPPASDPLLLPLSFDVLLNEYRTFLEVVVHSLLFLRRVYPSALFVQRAAWGVAAQRAQNPDVERYVSHGLDLILEALAQGSISCVALPLLDGEGEECERWHFALDDLLQLGLASPQARARRQPNALSTKELHGRFADALVRVASIASSLPALSLSHETTFRIVAETPEDARPPPANFVPAIETYDRSEAAPQQWVHLVLSKILDLAIMAQRRA